MKWYLLMGDSRIMDKAGDGGGGGGGGGNPPPDPKPDPKDDIIKALTARLDAIEAKGKEKPEPKPDDADLARKAQLKREEDDKRQQYEKGLETAIRFTSGAREWSKTNATLLPKSIAGILDQADKEVYGSTIEKDAAIKVGIVSEFFAEQANMDLLTSSQKSVLEDFKKLTKTDKQQRAAQIYDSIFEPVFEAKKREARAAMVNRDHSNQTSTEKAYAERLTKLSRQHYLGEKKDA